MFRTFGSNREPRCVFRFGLRRTNAALALRLRRLFLESLGFQPRGLQRLPVLDLLGEARLFFCQAQPIHLGLQLSFLRLVLDIEQALRGQDHRAELVRQGRALLGHRDDLCSGSRLCAQLEVTDVFAPQPLAPCSGPVHDRRERDAQGLPHVFKLKIDRPNLASRNGLIYI